MLAKKLEATSGFAEPKMVTLARLRVYRRLEAQLELT